MKQSYFKYIWIFIFVSAFGTWTYTFDQQLDLRLTGMISNAENYSDATALGSIYARYTLRNEFNDRIRANFSINANAGTEWSYLGVYQAYMRVRFTDNLRMTFGKAPVTWGEGVFYNAGDIFFNSSSTGILLSSIEIRDNSQWMTDMYISLGRYSYFQIIAVLPSLPDFVFTPTTGVEVSLPSIKETSAGWRVGSKLGDVQFQLGGAYLGSKTWYTSYISIATGLFDLFDFYVNTRLSVGEGLMKSNRYKETWEISTGLSYSTAVDNGMFSVRLEAMFRPFQNWKSLQDEESIATEINDNVLGSNSYYGNEIYLEIGGNLTSYLSLFIRNIFSTIDISDYMSIMFTYTPIDKFSLALNIGVQMGSEYDLFAFKRAGATNIYLMARYVYE